MVAPRVSIIVPVYNGSRFLAEALDSAVAQTFENLEIVVVDDGSDDEGATARIGNAYASAHENITYVYQINRGVAAALNTGIATMSGELFCWLSHDDRFEPTKTEEQVAFYDRLGDPRALIFSDWIQIDENGREIERVALDHQAFLRTPLLALVAARINGCTVLCHKSTIQGAGGFDGEKRYAQDYYLWTRLRQSAHFFHMPKPLLRYRVHAGQHSNVARAIEEGETFWIHLMNTMTRYEKASIAGNSRAFLKLLRHLLADSPYGGAVEAADDGCLDLAKKTRISVILVDPGDLHGFGALIKSLALQDFRRLELIVVTDREYLLHSILEEHGLPSWRHRFVRSCGDADSCIARAILSSSCEYVTVVNDDPIEDPGALFRQLLAMQSAGARVSRADLSSPDTAPREALWMMHASIIEEGDSWPLTCDRGAGKGALRIEPAWQPSCHDPLLRR